MSFYFGIFSTEGNIRNNTSHISLYSRPSYRVVLLAPLCPREFRFVAIFLRCSTGSFSFHYIHSLGPLLGVIPVFGLSVLLQKLQFRILTFN
jgi:hypothetical protein